MRNAIFAGLVLLAGCSEPEDNPLPPPLEKATPSTAHYRSLDELRRAIGGECAAIEASEYKGSANGREFYAVRCTGEADYLVSIRESGETGVLPCATARAMARLECWQPWD